MITDKQAEVLKLMREGAHINYETDLIRLYNEYVMPIIVKAIEPDDFFSLHAKGCLSKPFGMRYEITPAGLAALEEWEKGK